MIRLGNTIVIVGLNFVTDQMTLANAFTDVEPEANLGSDQCVQPGFLHSQILPGSGASSRNDASDSVTDGWNVTRGRWRQFNLGVLQKYVELWPSLVQQRRYQ